MMWSLDVPCSLDLTSIYHKIYLNIKMWAPSRDISKIRSWTIEKLAGCSLGIWPQVWKCPEGDPLGVSHHGLSALWLEDDTWENHSEILWTLPAGRHSIAEVQTRVHVLLPEFRSSNVPFAFLVRYVSYGPFFVDSYGRQWGFSLQPFGERHHQFLPGRLVNESKCLLPANQLWIFRNTAPFNDLKGDMEAR